MTIHLAQDIPHPKTNPTSAAFYDVWVGNGAGLFFQQLLAQAHTGYEPTPSFIIICLIVQKLSCWQTNRQTNKDMPLKTPTSLCYAMPVD